MIIWFYGLPGAGKTTAARAWVEDNYPAVLLDGDVMRKVTENTDFSYLGISGQSRSIAILAKELTEFGVNVAIAACTPHIRTRSMLDTSFIPGTKWVHLDTPRDVCRKRKPEIYAKFEDSIADTEVLPEEYRSESGIDGVYTQPTEH